MNVKIEVKNEIKKKTNFKVGIFLFWKSIIDLIMRFVPNFSIKSLFSLKVVNIYMFLIFFFFN